MPTRVTQDASPRIRLQRVHAPELRKACKVRVVRREHRIELDRGVPKPWRHQSDRGSRKKRGHAGQQILRSKPQT